LKLNITHLINYIYGNDRYLLVVIMSIRWWIAMDIRRDNGATQRRSRCILTKWFTTILLSAPGVQQP